MYGCMIIHFMFITLLARASSDVTFSTHRRSSLFLSLSSPLLQSCCHLTYRSNWFGCCAPLTFPKFQKWRFIYLLKIRSNSNPATENFRTSDSGHMNYLRTDVPVHDHIAKNFEWDELQTDEGWQWSCSWWHTCWKCHAYMSTSWSSCGGTCHCHTCDWNRKTTLPNEWIDKLTKPKGHTASLKWKFRFKMSSVS